MANRSKYKKEYCELLVKHLSSGLSYESFVGEIRVGLQTMYDWEKSHPEWAEAKEFGVAMGMKFYEQRLMLKASGQAAKGITTKDIDMRAVEFALKTRWYKVYGDRQRVEHSTDDKGIHITISEEDSEL